MLANIGDAIIGTDKNYLINYWNPAAERMYGYKKDEIIGQYAGIFRARIFGNGCKGCTKTA